MDHFAPQPSPVGLPVLDARPRFPENITIAVPLGTRDALRASAADLGVSSADLGRRILEEHIANPPRGGLLTNPTIVWNLPGREHALITIGAHEVTRAWAEFNLNAAVVAANPKVPGAPFDPDVLRRACEVGKHQLWMTVKDRSSVGMAVTGIFTEPGPRKVLTWVLVTGRGFTGWAWTREHIEAWARDQGCKAARAYARPGWKRLGLSDYTPKGVILERAL